MRISNDLHMIDLVLQDVNLLKRTRSKSYDRTKHPKRHFSPGIFPKFTRNYSVKYVHLYYTPVSCFNLYDIVHELS